MVTIGHVEIPAREVGRLAAFYHAAFGWEAAPLAWEGPPYVRLRPADEALARPRRVALASGQPGFDQPLVVLEVLDEPLAAVLERVLAAGGAVTNPPAPVAGFGWFAIITDPEGNRLGLWTAACEGKPISPHSSGQR